MTTPSDLYWFTSSYSGGSGTECVECALTGDGTLVRDTKHAEGSVVAIDRRAWQAFIRALRQGETETNQPIAKVTKNRGIKKTAQGM